MCQFLFIGIYKIVEYEEHRVGLQEPVFFPSDETGTNDGDGYLGTFIYNYQTNQTTFEIFDVTTMDTEPVTVVEIPRRVPGGFHSIFVERNDFEKRHRK